MLSQPSVCFLFQTKTKCRSIHWSINCSKYFFIYYAGATTTASTGFGLGLNAGKPSGLTLGTSTASTGFSLGGATSTASTGFKLGGGLGGGLGAATSSTGLTLGASKDVFSYIKYVLCTFLSWQ